MAQKRSTICCSVKSAKPAPPVRPTAKRGSDLSLSLQAHGLLRVLVGRQLFLACRIAVAAEEEGHEVRVGLRTELAGPIRRHGQADIAIQRRDAALSPARAEIAALERRPAELTVIERRAMAVLAALAIGCLPALRLRRCVEWGGWLVLRRHRDGAAEQDRGCKRQSGKLAEKRDRIHLEHPKLEHRAGTAGG